jgi:hypothetical protein
MQPRNIVKTHLSENFHRYSWRNRKTHALAEFFCKANKSGFFSTNGLVRVVVPKPCLIGTFFALHFYFSDSIFHLSD